MGRICADSQRVLIQQGFNSPQTKRDRARANFCEARSSDQRIPEKQILHGLNTTDQTIRSLVEGYKLATTIPIPDTVKNLCKSTHIRQSDPIRLISLADRLVSTKGTTLGNHPALYDLSELVCYALSDVASNFSYESQLLSQENLDKYNSKTPSEIRSEIGTIKRTIDAFLRMKGKWGIVSDHDKHTVRYNWKSGIRRAESMLPKEPSCFDPLIKFFSDLFTPAPRVALQSYPKYSEVVGHNLRMEFWNRHYHHKY